MSDYAKTIDVATAWVREGMRQAPTDDLRGLWEAALGRAVLAAGKAPKRATPAKIRALLKRAGLSQLAAARALEINPRTMRRYVLGETTIQDEHLGKLERLAEEASTP